MKTIMKKEHGCYTCCARVWVTKSSSAVCATTTTRIAMIMQQTQDGEAFLDPVPIEITNGSEKTRITIQPNGKIATAHLRTRSGPVSIQVDPDQTLLKEVVSGQMVN